MKLIGTLIASAFTLFFSSYPPLNGQAAIYAYGDSHSNREALYAKGSLVRNYNAVLLADEQKEISFVLETVGNSSLYSIARAKSTIKHSGKLVEHVHPLKFLAFIFTSEKLKACLHNVRGRSWVWGQFFKGLKNSFDEESARNNILPHIKDFTRSVGVDTKTFYSLAENSRWKEFMDGLLKEIPKLGNSGRYDM